MICLEEYNTLNTSTGIIECEIRLPCHHGVGSACIVNWLGANNNCPKCRATFFSAQPQPYFEHEITNDDRPYPAPTTPESPIGPPRGLARVWHARIHNLNGSSTFTSSGRPIDGLNANQRNISATELTRFFCTELNLPECATGLAESMAGLLANSTEGQGHSLRCIASVCIFMAAYVIRRPKNVSEISWVAGTGDEDIRNLYRRIYSVREGLIDLEDLERRGSGSTITALRAFGHIFWPSLEGVESGFLLGM